MCGRTKRNRSARVPGLAPDLPRGTEQTWHSSEGRRDTGSPGDRLRCASEAQMEAKMKRMKFLFGQRRMQVLLTLAVLLLAASVVIGSGASFTSQSANPSNTFTAGTLTHTNSKAPAAVLTAGPLMPGDTSAPGTVIITNTGGAGNFRLFMTGLTDVHGDTIDPINGLSLIHISEPTRLGMISYAVFC